MKHVGYAQLNGQRFARFEHDDLATAALVHERAVDPFRALVAWGAHDAAPFASWELIFKSGGVETSRLRVPGGWMVRHVSDGAATAIFAPDSKHGWTTKILETR